LIEPPLDAVVIPAREAPQGCLKIAALTAARLLVHLSVLVLVLAVLLGPVLTFQRYFEEQSLKIPAITVLLINLSRRLASYGYLIIPGLLLMDMFLLIVFQVLPRPWRFLSRMWFSACLCGAVLLLVLSFFAVAVPIDVLLPRDKQVIAPQEAIEDAQPIIENDRER